MQNEKFATITRRSKPQCHLGGHLTNLRFLAHFLNFEKITGLCGTNHEAGLASKILHIHSHCFAVELLICNYFLGSHLGKSLRRVPLCIMHTNFVFVFLQCVQFLFFLNENGNRQCQFQICGEGSRILRGCVTVLETRMQ